MTKHQIPQITEFTLSSQDVERNGKNLLQYMQKEGLSHFYISSFNESLSEYVPLQDSLRFYFTGFTGSVAEVLVSAQGPIKIYVDGRYHEQADKEVTSSLVKVEKCSLDKGISQSLLEDLSQENVTKLGYVPERTSLNYLKSLKEYGLGGNDKLSAVPEKHLLPHINYKKVTDFPPIMDIEEAYRTDPISQKLQRLFAQGPGQGSHDAYFLTALEDIAWITNWRGYHLPYQSSFLAKALVVSEKIYLFIEPHIQLKVQETPHVEIIKTPYEELEKAIQGVQQKQKINQVYAQYDMLNMRDYTVITKCFGEKNITNIKGGLTFLRSLKTPLEMTEIKRAFERSEQVVAKSISWVRQNLHSGKKVSEWDFYNQVNQYYHDQGAITLSFKTIAAIGVHSSMIHFSSPEKDLFAQDNDLVLLDSGGYYEAGLATDITRAFLAAGDKTQASSQQKDMYTLVLKALLRLQNAVFKKGTPGSSLDYLCRFPLYEQGQDFNHGTGHGIGIHVHEDGVRISPTSSLPMQPGQLVSLEPGLYEPGFGGVRLENVGLVVEHPTIKGFLSFEVLVYVGFDHNLIDMSKLNEQEKQWLDQYERECQKRGTSFVNS